MKKQDTIVKLNHLNLFNIDRFEENNNFESGSSVTLGFDYIKKNDKNFKLSAGQVINKGENNKKPSSSSLDEKLSDFVGNSTLALNENVNFSYNFALDQNWCKDLNYNDLGAKFFI